MFVILYLSLRYNCFSDKVNNFSWIDLIVICNIYLFYSKN